MRRALVLACAAWLAGCGVRGRELDPTEHVRGEHHRLVHEPVDRLWPALLTALDAEGLRVTLQDRARGTIATAPSRYGERDVQRLVGQIADLSAMHGEGLSGVGELRVAYFLLLKPAGDDTSLGIRSRIEAEGRGNSGWLAPGVFQVIPHRVELPSRGVVERELMRRLASNLFTAEEVLFMLGEPGVD